MLLRVGSPDCREQFSLVRVLAVLVCTEDKLSFG